MYARVLLLALLLSIITVNARHQAAGPVSEDEDSVEERREVKDQPQRSRDVQRHRRKRWQSVHNRGYDYGPSISYYPNERPDFYEDEDSVDERREVKDQPQRSRDVQRHPRKRWQSVHNHDYDYQLPPLNSYYPNERRDYYNQPDLNDVLRLLDDIRRQLSRSPPPPPPQPIYIGYPYPVPQPCQCTSKGNNSTIPPGGFPSRFPEMEDDRQNWGFVKSEDDVDEQNYSRPINFTPTQGQSSTSSQGNKSRSSCDAVILLCCVPTASHINRQMCFSNHDCSVTYSTKGCTKESIDGAIDRISRVYSPV